MQNEPKLGLFPAPSEQRDAIHVAIIPVVAGAALCPGQHVGIDDGKAVPSRVTCPTVGVVDPFLRVAEVRPGDRFWLLLKPYTIASLRHDWTHPKFPPTGPAEAGESEKWLRRLAQECEMDYDAMLARLEAGEPICLGFDTPDMAFSPDLWRHVEAVTGKRFDQQHRESTYFSCAC